MTINLKVPDLTELKPRITVFGVGGAGGNAVNNMLNAGLEGVDFVVANTDAQALSMSCAERRIQMGTSITEGLGAGSKPEIGAAAAEEALNDIKAHLADSHMVFVTAGMGGGTGTGAAPVIARAAQEEDILTVGVITKPFQFEGQRRMDTADAGIAELAGYVDTLIVIPNQNLFRVANEKTTFTDAFALADRVLHSGVGCITDLMVKEGLINLDFADVKAVMAGMGKAMMGTGEASGERRALEAAEAAIANPLLDDVSMRGARGLLISITGGNDLTLYEVDEAASRIREEVDENANIILGATFDESLDGQIRVSVVATGLDEAVQAQKAPVEPVKDIRKPGLTQRLDNLQMARETAAPARPAPKPEGQPDPTVWKGPGDVTIEKRPPQVAAAKDESAPHPAPAPQEDATFMPQQPVITKQPPRRMPGLEDLPIVAQNEIKAAQGEAPESGLEAQKKKVGFLERLTGVGRNRKSDELALVRDREPELERPAAPPAPSAVPAQRASASADEPPSKTQLIRAAGTAKPAIGGAAVAIEEDDNLEIPAFLRRQAK